MTDQMPQIWSAICLAAAVSATGFALLWPLSLLRRDASLVDLWWGPGFAVFTWTALLVAGTQPGAHGWAALGLVTLWALRMGWTMTARRLRAPGEDPRYVALRAARGAGWWWKSLFHVFTLQAAIQVLLVLPVAVLVLSAPAAPGLWLGIGALVALAGLGLETVADVQLDRWQAAHPGTLNTTRLRSIVRHPNYVGEILFWIGIALIGLEGGVLWAPLTPLVLGVLLTSVSGRPMMEDRLSRHPEWAAYAARIPAFLPRL